MCIYVRSLRTYPYFGEYKGKKGSNFLSSYKEGTPRILGERSSPNSPLPLHMYSKYPKYPKYVTLSMCTTYPTYPAYHKYPTYPKYPIYPKYPHT